MSDAGVEAVFGRLRDGTNEIDAITNVEHDAGSEASDIFPGSKDRHKPYIIALAYFIDALIGSMGGLSTGFTGIH